MIRPPSHAQPTRRARRRPRGHAPRPRRLARRSPLDCSSRQRCQLTSKRSVHDPEPFERAVERPDPLDSPGTHKPGLVAPRGRRLARVAWIRRPAVRQGARSPARLPHTTESCCMWCQSPTQSRPARSARATANFQSGGRCLSPPPQNPTWLGLVGVRAGCPRSVWLALLSG